MGDILDRVDDVDVAVLSTEALAKLMLGPPGTSIVCSFRRKDERYSTSSFLLRPQTCKSLCDDAVHSHFVRKTYVSIVRGIWPDTHASANLNAEVMVPSFLCC